MTEVYALGPLAGSATANRLPRRAAWLLYAEGRGSLAVTPPALAGAADRVQGDLAQCLRHAPRQTARVQRAERLAAEPLRLGARRLLSAAVAKDRAQLFHIRLRIPHAGAQLLCVVR